MFVKNLHVTLTITVYILWCHSTPNITQNTHSKVFFLSGFVCYLVLSSSCRICWVMLNLQCVWPEVMCCGSVWVEPHVTLPGTDTQHTHTLIKTPCVYTQKKCEHILFSSVFQCASFEVIELCFFKINLRRFEKFFTLYQIVCSNQKLIEVIESTVFIYLYIVHTTDASSTTAICVRNRLNFYGDFI